MNRPALYHKSHLAAKQDVGEIIKDYASKLQWRADGCDTLLDVGSGPCDVLMDYIHPIMPPNFQKIVCSDLSTDMIEYAKRYYHNVKKCKFITLDIATKMGLPIEMVGDFDHVTSIFCLHWVQDHRMALENISNLLRPEGGGDCLLIFMSSHNIFDAYNYAMKHTKWSEYIKRVDHLITFLHYSTNAQGDFAALMEDAGFCDITVDLKTRTFNYGSLEYFKENVKSICGVMDCIPEAKHSEFLDDFVAAMSKFASTNSDPNELQSKYVMKYDLLVAYGRRPQIK